MAMPGLNSLSELMHIFSLSLLVPTVGGLLALLAWSLFEMGGYLAEIRQRRQEETWDVTILLQELGRYRPEKGIDWDELFTRHQTPPSIKREFLKFAANPGISPATRKILARRLLETREEYAARVLDRTDVLAKVGPMLGLMGTLIPLGPGLAALSSGDLAALSQAVIVAFDTTVTGLVVGGLCFWITRRRQRRFERALGLQEAVLETMLEVMDNNAAPKSKTNLAAVERRPDERACQFA